MQNGRMTNMNRRPQRPAGVTCRPLTAVVIECTTPGAQRRPQRAKKL